MGWARLRRWFSDRSGLCAIVLFAFALRLAMITWGIGIHKYEAYYHADEQMAYSTVEHFPRRYLNNKRFTYGTAIQNTAGILQLPFKVVQYFRGERFNETTRRHVAILILRGLNLLIGIAAIPLAYILAMQLYDDRRLALLASVLLSVSFLHAGNSAFCTLDVSMSTLMLALLLWTSRSLKKSTWMSFLLLGCLGGYFAGTKMSSIAIIPSILLLFMMAVVCGKLTLARAAGGLMIAAVASAAVYAISSLHIILQYNDVVDYMDRVSRQYMGRQDNSLPGIAYAWSRAAWYCMNPVVCVLGFVGVCLGLPQKHEGRRAMYASIVLFVLSNVVIWRGYVPPRFFLPLSPLWCILAARAVCLAAMWKPQKIARHTAVALAAATLVVSLGYCVAGIWHRYNDTRTRVAAFIDQHIPDNSTIYVDIWPTRFLPDGQYQPSVYLNPQKHVLVGMYDDPDYIVIDDYRRQANARFRLLLTGIEDEAEQRRRLESVKFDYDLFVEDINFKHQLFEGESSYRAIKQWKSFPKVRTTYRSVDIWLFEKQENGEVNND